ncbi:CvpA family protein [Pseudodesulfovibrio pelocollis]|uniref:CvpA family protein n=1 Tax=Pseudodesulfovibrio pelocollis TaxID=3051432 RepID=UPI00255A8A2C|nr:CvpA family protein [Pseudodesulfovibrio sp. SB368]
MNFLDFLLIGIAAIFLIRGLVRGLVREVLSLSAIILGVFLASRYQHLLVPHLEMYIKNEMTVDGLAYVCVFLGTVTVFWALAKLLRSALDISLLGWVDRTTGGVFGLIEGVLVGLIFLTFIQAFAPESAWLRESTIAPRSQHMVGLMVDLVPESMRDTLKGKGFELPTAQDTLDAAREALGLPDEGEPQ